MLTAQMALQHYFNVFDTFRQTISSYIRMIEYQNVAKNNDNSDKAEKMANILKERLVESGMFEYCAEFDKTAGILQDRWPKLMENIN